MGKTSMIIRTILFNILVILTIIFIYILFFPKKSYVKTKLEEGINTEENNKKEDNNKTEENTPIEENKKEDKTEDKKENNCLYKYEKKIEASYSEWSNWSNWDTKKIEKNDLTNVEEKIEKVLDGTKKITDTKEISIDATKNIISECPSGYTKTNNECIKKEEGKIDATIYYYCPKGYSRTGEYCYKLSEKINASKGYTCPKNTDNMEYELSGTSCRTIKTIKENLIQKENYSCPQGYNLSNVKCYKTEEYTKEIENYKDVTYYRYQTREKIDEKYDVKWSTLNDKDLLNQEYNMVEESTCDF